RSWTISSPRTFPSVVTAAAPASRRFISRSTWKPPRHARPGRNRHRASISSDLETIEETKMKALGFMILSAFFLLALSTEAAEIREYEKGYEFNELRVAMT